MPKKDDMPARVSSPICPWTKKPHEFGQFTRPVNGYPTSMVLCKTCGQRP